MPATPEPSPTRSTVAELPAAFRDFVRAEVAPALAAGDVSFFERHAVTEPIVCTPDNTPSLPGGPNCQTVGREFDGFVLGTYQSELFVVPLEEGLHSIQQLKSQEAANATDDFGDATPRVYALGVPSAAWVIRDGASVLIEDQSSHAVVLTGLIERPAGLSNRLPNPIRAVAILNWIPAAEGYELASVISAVAGGREFLEVSIDSWPLWEAFEP